MAKLVETEWTFAADVASWINEIVQTDPSLPFGGAKVERHQEGKRTRRDLEILTKDGRTTAISGEIKLPESAEGKTPYHTALVESAHDKADACGVDYFFTWNVNQLVLWRTYQSGVPLHERDLQPFEVVRIRDAQELQTKHVIHTIKVFLHDFLKTFARIYLGQQPLFVKPLDERFLHIIESSLADPVAHAQASVFDRYPSDGAFRRKLNRWMVTDQGWTVTKETINENLDRAAKLSCYVAANKLIFYNVLRKRFTRLPVLKPARKSPTVRQILEECAAHFDKAMTASGDYQTVFIEDFGSELAFLNNDAAVGWQQFIAQLNDFDLSQLNYDVIGPIFERLMSPEERHRFGQHYTTPDVVDLINGLCIRSPMMLSSIQLAAAAPSSSARTPSRTSWPAVRSLT
jgi:hypothetical protein